MIRTVVAVLLSVFASVAGAEEIDAQRAHVNYMLYCQGCHLPDGSGGASVPDMKGQVGQFLRIPEGRDYLVRVPGSAGSTLNNKQLAEVLNWMILEFGEDSIPKNFQPYTATEVAQLRQEPLLEVEEHRKQLVKQLRGNGEK